MRELVERDLLTQYLVADSLYSVFLGIAAFSDNMLLNNSIESSAVGGRDFHQHDIHLIFTPVNYNSYLCQFFSYLVKGC